MRLIRTLIAVFHLTRWIERRPDASAAAKAQAFNDFHIALYDSYFKSLRAQARREAEAQAHPFTNAYVENYRYNCYCPCWRCEQERSRRAARRERVFRSLPRGSHPRLAVGDVEATHPDLAGDHH